MWTVHGVSSPIGPEKFRGLLGDRVGRPVFSVRTRESERARAVMTELPATGRADAASTHAPVRPLHQAIADFIVRTRFEDLPAAVVEKAKAQIVYQLGLALQGYYNYETEQLRAALSPLDQRSPSAAASATIIGEHSRVAPSDAAFANAVMMRALFLDDLLLPGTTHAGVVTLPAALAIGEVQRASGRDVLLAIVLGYEVLGKLSAATYGWSSPQPREPTMIYGAYGAVVATGKLLRLDAQQMAHALGFAANLCMGVPEGGQTDHYYGFFSRNGIVAAQLARVGSISYSANTLESQLGLYASFFGKVPANLPQIVARLGTDWEILRATRTGKSHSEVLDRYDLPFPRSAWRSCLEKGGIRLLGEKNVRDVERQVTDLEHVADVNRLMATLRPSDLAR
jgi:MmgE/PrpD N-terminal domain